MDKTLLVRVACSTPKAVLRINGLVLGQLREHTESTWPMHAYIQHGQNRIELEHPAKGAFKSSGLLTHDTLARVSIELHKDRGAGVLVQPKVLFEWSDTHLKGTRLPHGNLFERSVDLPVNLPRWHHLDLLPGANSEATLIALENFVAQLVSLFNEKQINSLAPLFHARNQELAAAYGQDFHQFHNQFLDGLQRILDTHTIDAACMDPSQWRFRPVRGGTLYFCCNPEGQALFQWSREPGSGSSAKAQLPMHLAVMHRDVLVIR